MSDLFENSIHCYKCNIKMEPIRIKKDNFILRAVKCNSCNNIIVHPKDEQDYQNFKEIRKKQFNVRLRYVGNSYAVTIPKEVVNVLREQEKVMDDMVKLCFEEMGKLSLCFHYNGIVDDKVNKDLGVSK